MEPEQKLKTLQMYYAASLADSTLRYGKAGILDEITKQKHLEQMANRVSLAERFGVKEPKHVFQKIQDIYGCADWSFEDTSGGFSAICTHCLLCSISRKIGPYSPCQINCLSPMEAMLKGIIPNAEFIIEKTLWNNDKCVITLGFK